ncbi:hypothetical protein BDM02DRAFT_2823812 [Thelephora ganbajun]|uniref:Uncharacterized protein n=1 Tax=Thelephora ganbajun TaxID=370292 RepID=A0ACB6ZBZ4_THEGA|nr:hypothetical protein BDM02DRAFT_2823812 [Thelephora ganbajun]
MMSSIMETIRAGEDIMIERYYSISMATLFMYDYFLTLPDEVQYMWKGEKRWMFYIFLVNRYAPFISQTWGIVVQSVISADVFFAHSLCRESTTMKALSFVISTLVAQIVIGTRAYALSEFNRKLLAVLLSIGTIYLVLAIVLVHSIVVAVGTPPKDPAEGLRMCLKDPGQTLGFLCVAAVLAFDTVTVTTIFVRVVKLGRETLGLSKIPSIMFRDVTIYCLVIFISHLSLIISVNIARPALKILPALGLEVMIPIMVSRFTFALRKAARKGSNWDEEIFTKSFVAPHTSHDDNVQPSMGLETI